MPTITKNWISGQKILFRWGIRDFELLGIVKKGLQPYSSDLGEPVLPPTMREKKDFLQEAKGVLKDLESKPEVLRKILEKPPIPDLVPMRDFKDVRNAIFDVRLKQEMKSSRSKLEVLRKKLGKPTNPRPEPLLDGPLVYISYSLETFEWIELYFIDRIKDVKKLIEDSKEELSKESGDWADYTPRSQEEEKQIIKKLLTHIYKVEEVNRMTGPPKIPAQMTTEQPPVKSPKKKLTPVQRHKKECRRVAKSLWKKDQAITIADMIQQDEICHACDDKVYNEKTIRNWIKDLCPDRSPGRRPKK